MKSLVIVDIQPLYHQHHRDITPKLLEYIEDNSNSYENIIWFYNSKEYGGLEETIDDMNDYIGDFGIISEEQFESIIFIDKNHGFFRSWMDTGVDEDYIKTVIEHMIDNGNTDSGKIDEKNFKMLFKTFFKVSDDDIVDEWSDEYEFFQDNPINIPQFNWGAIKGLKNVDLCGGSKGWCLAEIRILLELVDVEVNQLTNFIYITKEDNVKNTKFNKLYEKLSTQIIEKDSPCWDGYERTPNTKEGEKGSCRKKKRKTPISEKSSKCTKVTKKASSDRKGKKWTKCAKQADGSIKRIHWGQKGVKVTGKSGNTKRKKSFRARHNCKNAKKGSPQEAACKDW